MKYTGFADANFIAARDGIWFFEKCERFGYNAHPNLFWNLNLSTLGEVLSSLVDGTFRPQFSGGFGASVTMSTKENPAGCKLMQFPREALERHLLVGCVEAWRAPADRRLRSRRADPDRVRLHDSDGMGVADAPSRQVKFPFRHYRTDGDRTYSRPRQSGATRL